MIHPNFKPMLAGKCPAGFEGIRYPVIASRKLDGIRAIRMGNRLVSRSLKDIPNKHVREWCVANLPEGLDGELMLRDPRATFEEVTSAFMSMGGAPDFIFWVFDQLDGPTAHLDEFWQRHRRLEIPVDVQSHCAVLPQLVVRSPSDLAAVCAEHLAEGYEGTMIRDPHGLYKFGRSTTKEGGLLKIKHFEDEEAVVIGVVEEFENTNEATKDELGRTKRSSAKAGMVDKGRLGAFVCMLRDSTTFEVGSGFTEQQRIRLWAEAQPFLCEGRQEVPGHPGSISVNAEQWLPEVVVKHQPPPGGRPKGKPPRIPVFKGFRHPEDMS